MFGEVHFQRLRRFEIMAVAEVTDATFQSDELQHLEHSDHRPFRGGAGHPAGDRSPAEEPAIGTARPVIARSNTPGYNLWRISSVEPGKPGRRAGRSRRVLSDEEDKEMKFKPLGARALVQIVEREETTASGIVLPDTAKEKPQTAKVVAVGEGKLDSDGQRVPVEVAADDVIVFAKYSGTEISFDGEDYMILDADDILGIVES